MKTENKETKPNLIFPSIWFISEDVTAEFEDDGDDVHFCKKCNKKFTQLDLYLEHKIQHDNYKMVYSRSGHDRRVIVPKLVQRKTKPSSNATENVDGKENRQGLPKKGKSFVHMTAFTWQRLTQLYTYIYVLSFLRGLVSEGAPPATFV